MQCETDVISECDSAFARRDEATPEWPDADATPPVTRRRGASRLDRVVRGELPDPVAEPARATGREGRLLKITLVAFVAGCAGLCFEGARDPHLLWVAVPIILIGAYSERMALKLYGAFGIVWFAVIGIANWGSAKDVSPMGHPYDGSPSERRVEPVTLPERPGSSAAR
jgi:hypothetical protein